MCWSFLSAVVVLRGVKYRENTERSRCGGDHSSLGRRRSWRRRRGLWEKDYVKGVQERIILRNLLPSTCVTHGGRPNTLKTHFVGLKCAYGSRGGKPPLPPAGAAVHSVEETLRALAAPDAGAALSASRGTRASRAPIDRACGLEARAAVKAQGRL